jgi:hypothetical protein
VTSGRPSCTGCVLVGAIEPFGEGIGQGSCFWDSACPIFELRSCAILKLKRSNIDRYFCFTTLENRQVIFERPPILRSMSFTASLAGLMFAFPGGAAADSLNALIGSWGGSGTYTLQDGTREKLSCNGYYTGGSSQLTMAIRCAGPNNKIEIRSKLNISGNMLSGTWEERTYNAEGTVSGTASGNRLSFSIQGGVSGTMNVSYTGSSQDVSIATQGIPLKSVTVSLSRR